MKKNDFVIGVLGGMGTYATINLFKQYAEIFTAEKEWDRPRIIIDNRCTMPSRVRAFLYHENIEQLVDEMADSMSNLVDSGCTKIILACNTSHLFLPAIYKKVPTLENRVINIINNCVLEVSKNNCNEVYLLGSEGTIDSQIYQKELEKYNIKCLVPSKNEYSLLRECIEAVKQNKYDSNIERVFSNLVNVHDNCILGCTELPILYEKYKSLIKIKNVYDPLLLGLKKLKEEFEND